VPGSQKPGSGAGTGREARRGWQTGKSAPHETRVTVDDSSSSRRIGGVIRPLAAIFAFALLVAACHNPTDPSDDLSSQPHGRLAGTVSIGPNCPGPTTTIECSTPPSAYLARKILVYNEAHTTLLHTVDIDTQGLYVIALAPGKYSVDLEKSGVDRTSDLPAVVEIHANVTTTVNVAIDTGLR
jgi:hypothetical protein